MSNAGNENIGDLQTRGTQAKDARFPKSERLCSRIAIDNLFAKGEATMGYPLRSVYTVTGCEQGGGVKVLVVVGKRYFKRAVDRNLLKRRIREAYRLNKGELTGIAQQSGLEVRLTLNYIGREVLDYKAVENGTTTILGKILAKIIAKNGNRPATTAD